MAKRFVAETKGSNPKGINPPKLPNQPQMFCNKPQTSPNQPQMLLNKPKMLLNQPQIASTNPKTP